MAGDTVRISAWKACKDKAGYLTPCGVNDEAVTKFDVSAAGIGTYKLEFANKFMAEKVSMALNDVFEAGKRQAMAELRR